ncbi:hypothetical protein AB5N19_13316 [Seiridium cardinale]
MTSKVTGLAKAFLKDAPGDFSGHSEIDAREWEHLVNNDSAAYWGRNQLIASRALNIWDDASIGNGKGVHALFLDSRSPYGRDRSIATSKNENSLAIDVG